MTPNAIILSVGDELTLGQVCDTNSAWLSQQLAAIGLPVSAHLTVPDDQPAIEHAIRTSAERCTTLIISGGIGPTPDDLTRQALAAVLERPLEIDESWLAELHEFFLARGRPMPDMNRIQAMIPKGATLLWNHNGTAAGIHANLKSPIANRKCDVYVIPGVPKEMKLMFERSILPNLTTESGGGVILSKTLHTYGLGESAIAELLGPLMDRSRNPSVGTTVSAGIVSVRINARFPSKAEAQAQLTQTENECRTALGPVVYGADDETLPQVVGALLKSQNKTVSTAESCTGGLLAKYLTDIPGSSAFFQYGWVTYANAAKTDQLNVPPETLQQHGAVSEQTVAAMAAGALAKSCSDFALSISGIAGPDGGTPAKPVGTVCIALASSLATRNCQLATRSFLFYGDREMIRDRSAKTALALLRHHLLGHPTPL